MTAQNSPAPFALAIHGGSGDITPKNLSPAQEAACRAVLNETIEAGHAMLRDGATSLDVVESAVRALEDCPFFNAGVGATFNFEGQNELDSSIMDGKTQRAGAVAGVSTIAHPVSAARAVMEQSPYVLLIGRGAEEFALQSGLEIVDPTHFFTQLQFDKLQKMRDSGVGEYPDPSKTGDKFGTVGAVALDRNGDLAAATSTGGMMGKRFGRVGDTPIVGAGTYASNATCAVSSTGHGEHFLCNVVAYDIAALMEYRGLSLEEATREVVLKKLPARGGDGGVIGVDKAGNVALTFNSAGMFRASMGADGAKVVGVFR